MKKREMSKNEEKALKICAEEVKKAKLPMKMIDADYNADERMITFRFSADNRVDFRDLVKILKDKLHVKVELRQVGARDEAMEIGGLPPCGQEELCCAMFKSYPRVTEEMLEKQGIKPSQKMYGYCGRIKCCYAHEFFSDGTITENRAFPCPKCTATSLCPKHAKGKEGSKPENDRYIYLIRHPKTVINNHKLYIDGYSDVELSKEGLKQAEKIAKRLKRENLSKIYTSPLKRAKDAAKKMSKTLSLPLGEKDGLREINVGIWRGMDEKDIIKKHPKLWKAWLEKPEITKIPEGESLSDVQKRVVRTIKECLKESEGNIAIVCHKIVIMTYLMSIRNIPLNKAWNYDKRHPIKMGAIIKLKVE